MRTLRPAADVLASGHALQLRPLRHALSLLWLGSLPLAWAAPIPGTPLAVSPHQSVDDTVQWRVGMHSGLEPVLDWQGTATPAPYRLVLAWKDATVSLDRPLPELPSERLGSLEGLTWHSTPEHSRLDPTATVAPVIVASNTALTPVVTAPTQASVGVPRPLKRPRRQAQPGSNGNPEVLLVDVFINGQRLKDVVRTEQLPGGPLLLPAEAWTEARLTPLPQLAAFSDGTPAYALDAVPGATYLINRQSLSVEINAPATAFVGSTLRLQDQSAAPPPRPQPGVMLNYDLSLGHSADNTSSGATLEAVAFNGVGTIVSSALVSDTGSSRGATRLDTYWRYDLPHRMESLTVGDAVGVGGGWSRPARFGGIRWGRDFGMRPGFVTLPQVSLAGEAALPSTVEVLVNNARRLSQPVQPGPFDLINVPIVTGAGEIGLVVRDLLGRETVVRQSYYASPRLLAPGLTDFSFEAGWLRTGYGRDSAYGDGFGAATWRQGVTRSLTGEGRVELQHRRRAAGVELASLLGTWGVGRLALAASSSDPQGLHERGQLLQAGIERSTPRGGGALQYEFASRGFAPFGEATDLQAATQRARERWLASLGGTLWGTVSGGVSYVHQTRWDGDRVTVLGLSLSMPLWQRASMSMSVNKRLDDDRSWSAGVSINVSLDDGLTSASRVERGTDGQLTGAVSAARNAPAGPGLGWRVQAATTASQRAQAGLQYNTSHSEWALDAVASADGQLSTRMGGRGTVGSVGGMVFASRPVGQGSVAVVKVGGIEGVPVWRSHQVVARTDARGLAFVPGLLPWQKNQIEIDPVDLPLDAEVANTVLEVTPYARSGVVMTFDVRRTRQALLVLHQADGAPVPVGAKVRLLPDGPEFMAGRRGEVWLTDLSAESQRVQVRWTQGGCTLLLAVPASTEGMPGKIGPLACQEGKP